MSESVPQPAASRRAFLATAGTGLFAGCGDPRPSVTLYCAADRLHAEPILREFEAQTGVRVAAKFDTEATKSLSLTQSLVREAAAPRCDVFWNNERLGTEGLAARGLLAPHRGPGWGACPPHHRGPNGLWTGIGGRLRVWIVNTDRMSATREACEAELAKTGSGRGGGMSFAHANPRYGTTLTHIALLHRRLGDGLWPEVQRWRAAGATVGGGNGRVKDLVAAGTVACGWTDTDDAHLALEAGAPVATLPVFVPDTAGVPRPVCIPNTVALVRGGPGPVGAAESLVTFLASEEVAVRLARGPSRQIPLRPVAGALPEDVRAFAELAETAVPLDGLLPHRAAVLDRLAGASA